MKYFTAIATLLGLNIISVITLLYFSSISRKTEKENELLKMQISKYSEQLKINEIELSLHNNRSYLTKLQKIYFDTENIDLLQNTRINLKDYKKKELKNIYMVNSN